MARIFFHKTSGKIYGVHPGPHETDRRIRLPADVVWIDVPETPDKIPWPVPAGRPDLNVRKGEHWCRVSADSTIEVDPTKVPPAPKEAALITRINRVLDDVTVAQSVKDLLIEWKHGLQS